jgi:fructose-1,6-bisphosphatase/inositol monophosphatase family enzyme
VSAILGYTLSRNRPGQGIRQTVGVTDVMDEVSQLLREAADDAVLPVFGRAGATAEEKAPGEWVTIADRAAESFLAPRLAALLPGSVVIGEEMASADADLLMHLRSASDAWLLDPLDGTANFAAETGPFAMMAALMRHGRTVAAWILDPQSDSWPVRNTAPEHGSTAAR